MGVVWNRLEGDDLGDCVKNKCGNMPSNIEEQLNWTKCLSDCKSFIPTGRTSSPEGTTERVPNGYVTPIKEKEMVSPIVENRPLGIGTKTKKSKTLLYIGLGIGVLAIGYLMLRKK